MKSIKGTSSPQSGIFRKLALGVLLFAILDLFIGGQQGAPRPVQSTNTKQEVTVQDILEFDLVYEIGGQKVPGGSLPLQSSSSAKASDAEPDEIGGPSTGTTVPKPTLPVQLFCNYSTGDIGGQGNQGAPRGCSDNYVEIGDPQNTPRGYAYLDLDIGGQQSAPRGYASSSFDIGGPQNAPRGYAYLDLDIGGQQSAPRGYANSGFDIGGQQSAPRPYANMDFEIGGQHAPRNYAFVDHEIGGQQNPPRNFYSSIVRQ